MAALSERAAIRKALVAYLQGIFPASVSTWAPMWNAGRPIGFSENWPAPQQLPTMPHVSILTGSSLAAKGYGVRIEKHTPNVISTTPTTGGQGTVLYSFGRAWIDFTIECWAQFEAVRDLMVSTLDAALDVDPNTTLATGALADFGSKPGLVLPLGANYYGTNADFKFDPVPQVHEETKLAEVSEWRASYSGEAHLYLCRQQTVYLLTDIIAQLTVGPSVAIDSSGNASANGTPTETTNIVP